MFPNEAEAFFIGAALIGIAIIGVIGWAVIEGIRYLIP